MAAVCRALIYFASFWLHFIAAKILSIKEQASYLICFINFYLLLFLPFFSLITSRLSSIFSQLDDCYTQFQQLQSYLNVTNVRDLTAENLSSPFAVMNRCSAFKSNSRQWNSQLISTIAIFTAVLIVYIYSLRVKFCLSLFLKAMCSFKL